MNDLETLLQSRETKIVDVRTPNEFVGGHIEGSINIPLQVLPQHINDIRAMGQVVLCCASGGRSAIATDFLKANGIFCINGGSWQNVYKLKTKDHAASN